MYLRIVVSVFYGEEVVLITAKDIGFTKLTLFFVDFGISAWPRQFHLFAQGPPGDRRHKFWRLRAGWILFVNPDGLPVTSRRIFVSSQSELRICQRPGTYHLHEVYRYRRREDGASNQKAPPTLLKDFEIFRTRQPGLRR